MIIRVLIAVVLAVPAYFYTMRYNIHMFQQNGYKNKEHLHWLKKKFRLQWILYFGLALGIVTCVFPYLALEIFEYLVLFVIIVVYRAMKRMNTKKKLVYTARVKRLLTTELILTAAVFALVCGLGGMKRIPGLCLILVSVNLFLDIVANVINHPMEAGINQHYINDAVRKLKSVQGLTVIGVTGSYGKTSVKFYLQTLLQEKYNVLVTPESFNTPMGVVRTIRGSLKPTTEIFVCEMGARHVGDIKEMCRLVHPTIGIITSVGPQHLETFKSIERIAKTKYELIDALPTTDSHSYFYNDGSYCLQMYQKTEKPKTLCGSDESADVYATDCRVSGEGSIFTLHVKGKGSIECHTRLLGAHSIQNILLAAAVASDLGLSLKQIAHGVEKLQPVKNRLELMNSPGSFTIINDAFNSNPVGAKAALEVLRQFPQRRIIITPGMVELGEKEAEYNREFGRQMAGCVDIAIIVGKGRATPILDGLKEAGFPDENAYRVDSLEESTRLLHTLIKPTDTVLYENDLPDHYQEA